TILLLESFPTRRSSDLRVEGLDHHVFMAPKNPKPSMVWRCTLLLMVTSKVPPLPSSSRQKSSRNRFPALPVFHVQTLMLAVPDGAVALIVCFVYDVAVMGRTSSPISVPELLR